MNSLCSLMVKVLHCQCREQGSIPSYTALIGSQSPLPKSWRGKWRDNSVGLGLVLKTKWSFIWLGVGTSFLRIMIQILRKEGWVLNPNDRVVNAILRRCEANNGECPCHNTGEDKKCPCSDYRENDTCHCGLYLKMED